jgi:hypothetical protein
MGQHARPLKKGEIEALIAAVPLPSPLVAGLAREMEIRLLPLDEATVEMVLQRDRALRRQIVPKGSYRGQEADVATIAGIHRNALLAHKDLDEATAYSVVKAILSHPVEMQQACPFAKEFADDNLVVRIPRLPSHPGAERHFQEKERSAVYHFRPQGRDRNSLRDF